jgi:hypothetical protein
MLGALSSLGLDALLAVVTAVWFIVTGISKQRRTPSAGRRSVPIAPWVIIVRRIRGILELLGGLALITMTVLTYLKFAVPLIGLPLGIALSVLALWTAVESWIPPLRPARIIGSLIGFALAVFFTGFRG